MTQPPSPPKEPIRLQPFGKFWIIECKSAAIKKWIVLAEWPTEASARRDLKVWMAQGCFELEAA